MSVNPGFGGQSFIDSALRKIERLRKLIDASGRDIRLEVDGGIKVDNIRRVADAGADTFVAGSAIFGQPDYNAVIAAMRRELGARLKPGQPPTRRSGVLMPSSAFFSSRSAGDLPSQMRISALKNSGSSTGSPCGWPLMSDDGADGRARSRS